MSTPRPPSPAGRGPIEEELGPLDAQLAAAVSGLPASGVGIGDIHAMRAFIAGSLASHPPPDDDRFERRDVEVPTVGGAPPVAVRLYLPRRRPRPAPALVWLHGGGFVFGDLEVSDARCARLCLDLSATVASVDYRLAPEQPFPAAVEDAYAATRWVAEAADELGVDTARLAVGGSSAGATLAAAVALLARDRRGPALACQLLWQPATDDRCDTPSSREVVDPRVLHRQVQLEMWDHYLGPEGTRGPVSPYAAPARAEDLGDLPAAVITTAEHDPLRDEGRDYARRLRDSGVPTWLLEVPGTVHGFEELVPDAEISRRTHRQVVEALAAVLAGAEPPPATAGRP